jgi:hypothetical protein
MSDDAATKSWFLTLPGWLTALAALLTAIAGLAAALSGLLPKTGVESAGPESQDCIPGYVWRQAIPEDRVCVTVATQARTAQDNALAGSRRNPGGGPYGAATCLSGFVFREAFTDDIVCVTPETRDQAVLDNQAASLRIKR